jgi:hypothetical protein
MMIYFLFVKGVIEVGYNVYNSGLWKEWYNKQEQDTDDDTDTTYNAGLWNFNWHIKQANDEDTIVQEDDSKVEEDTYELEKIKTHVPFLPLDGIEETTSTHKDSKYSSPQEITPNGIKNDEINAGGCNSNVSNKLDGGLDVPISTPIYDQLIDGK